MDFNALLSRFGVRVDIPLLAESGTNREAMTPAPVVVTSASPQAAAEALMRCTEGRDRQLAVLSELETQYRGGEHFHDLSVEERLCVLGFLLHVAPRLNSWEVPSELVQTLLLTVPRSRLQGGFAHLGEESLKTLGQLKDKFYELDAAQLRWAVDHGDFDALVALSGKKEPHLDTVDPGQFLAREVTDPEARRALRLLRTHSNTLLQTWIPTPQLALTEADIARLLGWTPEGESYRDPAGRCFSITLRNRGSSLVIEQRLSYVLKNPHRLDLRDPLWDQLWAGLESEGISLSRSIELRALDESSGGLADSNRCLLNDTMGRINHASVTSSLQATTHGLQQIEPSLFAMGFVRRKDFSLTSLQYVDAVDRERVFALTQPEPGVIVMELYDWDTEPNAREPLTAFTQSTRGDHFPAGWSNWQCLTIRTSSGGRVLYTLVKDGDGRPMEEGAPRPQWFYTPSRPPTRGP